MRKINTMPESILEQAVIEAVKQEYQAVGINLDNYKTHFIIVSGAQMLGISLIIMVSAITIFIQYTMQIIMSFLDDIYDVYYATKSRSFC